MKDMITAENMIKVLTVVNGLQRRGQTKTKHYERNK